MLAGLVILFALLATAAGYAAFALPSAGGIGLWDAAFIVCAAVFVSLFVRLLWSKAASGVVGRGPAAGDRDEPDRTARGFDEPRRRGQRQRRAR